MSGDTVADMLGEQLDRLLARTCDRTLAARAEHGHWPTDLWSGVAELGLPRAIVPEALDGYGLSWSEAAPALQLLGYHAAPVPLAETMVGAWLLTKAGLTPPDGPIQLALKPLSMVGDELAGAAPVAWPEVAGAGVAVVRGDAGTRVCLSGAPRILEQGPDGRADWTAAPVLQLSDMIPDLATGEALPALAVVRSAQIAGALERVLQLCVGYANERVQFGRAIGKFQAVQHTISRLALEAAAAKAGAEFGLRMLDSTPHLAAATAKSRASRAAGAGAALAHQVHGAIGVTEEHSLHMFTRRLWRWRDESGSEHFWNGEIGARVLGHPGTQLWSRLVADVSEGSGRMTSDPFSRAEES